MEGGQGLFEAGFWELDAGQPPATADQPLPGRLFGVTVLPVLHAVPQVRSLTLFNISVIGFFSPSRAAPKTQVKRENF